MDSLSSARFIFCRLVSYSGLTSFIRGPPVATAIIDAFWASMAVIKSFVSAPVSTVSGFFLSGVWVGAALTLNLFRYKSEGKVALNAFRILGSSAESVGEERIG